MRVVDSTGKAIALGPEVGRGGEGVVYELASNPTLVAKIYHRPLDITRATKISAMILTGNPEILKIAAWPLAVLHDKGGVVGLLMRKVARSDEPVHELYTPKSRLRKFPEARWDFLLHVASNVARGFAAIHNAGHVVGDVNHGNILVSSSGTNTFIDCDSFQIQADGRIFLCPVGVPPYTPPELQNRQFNTVTRTKNHDAFGLAVLIFQLLFMGRHPFAGRFSGRGEMPIERAIAEFRFPYGRMAAKYQMRPPPSTLLLDQIPSALGDNFERAFSPEAASGAARPTPMEWLAAIGQLQHHLSRCTRNKVHVYSSHLSACPWCGIETQGILLFIDVRSVGFESAFNVDQLWRTLESLPALGVLAPIPTPQNSAVPSLVPQEFLERGRSRRKRIWAGVTIVVATVCLAVGFRLDSPYAWGLIIASIAVAFFLPRKLNKQRAATGAVVQEWERRYQDLQNKYAAECGDQPFLTKMQTLEPLWAEYKDLPLLRQRKLQELEKNKHAIQLNQFLDTFSVRTARILKVGDGRKQMLISYGIDSAADVTWESLDRVPGIGPKIARSIMEWRKGQEGKFRFDPQKAVPRVEIEKLDREIRARQSQLEQSLKSGVQGAVAIHSTIIARRKNYLTQLEQAVRQFVQARLNYRAS
jgi:DNA-binding helix-hairpin-helix protein with protein kinase domain